MVALERVARGFDTEELFEPYEIVGERVDEVGLDGILDDRVALVRDAGDMRFAVHRVRARARHVESVRPRALACAGVPLYALGDIEPKIDPEAFVHPEATIIGNVEIGPQATIWPQAVLRGDQSRIVIGARTSVQDGAVIHCTRTLETIVGADCVIGHLAHLEGCTVEAGALIGTGSIVLHRAIVRTGSLVGAGALVPGGMEVPSGAMALGVPAQLREGRVTPDMISDPAGEYVRNWERYRRELRAL